MLYNKRTIIFSALCAGQLLLGAASNKNVPKITFQSCFKQKTVSIPGNSKTCWAPFTVWQKHLAEHNVGLNARQHLAPGGAYHSWDIRGYIGFVGGSDAAIMHCLARMLFQMPSYQWDEFFQGLTSLDEMMEAVIGDFNRRHPSKSVSSSDVTVSGSYYDSDVVLCSVMPPTVQKAFEQHDLDPNNLKHMQVFAGYVKSLKESHQVMYLELDGTRERHFLQQEGIGRRKGLEHLV